MKLRDRATKFNRANPAITSAIFCFAMSVLGASLIAFTKSSDFTQIESMLVVQLSMTGVATIVAQLINGFTPYATLRSTMAAVGITGLGIMFTGYLLT